MIYACPMKTLAVLALLLSILPAATFGWLTGRWAPALAAGAVWFVLLLPLFVAARFGIERLIQFGSNLLSR